MAGNYVRGENVTSTGGAITRVSFYMNGAKLIDKMAAPYTFAAPLPATPGTFQFTLLPRTLIGVTFST